MIRKRERRINKLLSAINRYKYTVVNRFFILSQIVYVQVKIVASASMQKLHNCMMFRECIKQLTIRRWKVDMATSYLLKFTYQSKNY